jgi:hypothetical protein
MMFESGTTAAWYTFDFWTAGRYRTNATTTMTTRAMPTAQAWSLLEEEMMPPCDTADRSVAVEIDRLVRDHRSLPPGPEALDIAGYVRFPSSRHIGVGGFAYWIAMATRNRSSVSR